MSTYKKGGAVDVANDLRSRILSGEYPCGQRIPGVWEVAEMYGCSRATSNKVLWILAQDCLVTYSRGIATTVDEPWQMVKNIDARIKELEQLKAWAAERIPSGS